VKLQQTRQVAINLSEVEVYDMDGVNVAQGKPVTASTDYGGLYPIEKFVDGTTSMGHTLGSQIDWVQIDLGVETDVDYVKITNRRDCCSDRIIGTKVQLLDNSETVVNESPEIDTDKREYTIQFNGESTPIINTTEWTPRYVKLQHTRQVAINLSEVEVYDMDGVNVAQGKPVTASTNYGGLYPIEKFVDGTTTMGHTLGSQIDWVEIDVGDQSYITKVVIKNRGQSERTVGIKVQILGQSRAIIKESEPISTAKATYTIDFTSTPPVIT
jgi:hypothetical protein